MKILWVSHSSNLGGAELCMIEAIKGLSQRENITIDVIVPSIGPLNEVLKSLVSSVNIIFHPWWVNETKSNISYPRRLYGYAKSIPKLRKIVKHLHPDIVISNTLVIPAAAFVAKTQKIPHIWYIHEYLEEDHNFSFEFGRKLSLWMVDRLSQQVIVNSQAVFDRFKSEISPSKLNLVYYAVEIPDNSDISLELQNDNRFYVALIGRKTSSKGQKEAIEAVSILIKKQINVYLFLVGSGTTEYETELKEMVKDLNIESHVEFISFVKNPFSYMRSANAVLMCSKNEAFGRVIIEAMKLGKPIVASNTGSTLELIKDGWNGLIYKFGNPQSLAERIEQIYNNTSLAKEIGNNSYVWSHKNFNLENYSNDLLNVFQKAVKKKQIKFNR